MGEWWVLIGLCVWVSLLIIGIKVLLWRIDK